LRSYRKERKEDDSDDEEKKKQRKKKYWICVARDKTQLLLCISGEIFVSCNFRF
jgi:hypothetical protein